MLAAPGHQHRTEEGYPHHDVDLDLVAAGDRGAEAIAPDHVREVEAHGNDEGEREDALDRRHELVHDQILTVIRTNYRVDGSGRHWVTFVSGIANDLSLWDG